MKLTYDTQFSTSLARILVITKLSRRRGRLQLFDSFSSLVISFKLTRTVKDEEPSLVGVFTLGLL